MSKTVTRLYKTFQPINYILTLDPDVDSKKLTGTVVITGIKRGRPGQRLTFHQKDLKITSATVVKHDKKGDLNLPIARINNQNTLEEVRLHSDTLLYPGNYTVTMQFEGHVQSGMNGVYFSDYKVDGKTHTMVSTQLESHYARMAFPCIDEPEAKATFDLTLHSPLSAAVLANMPPAEQTQAAGKLVTRFQTTPKMSTYLLAFAFGDLQHKTAKTKRGVTVGVWATKAHNPAALDFALDVGVRSIEFFEEYYGVDYPLPKADHVAIPDFSAGAMENWGLITYRETALLADPESTSQSSREMVAMVICHEVSHQWFGDLVTMKWWDDLWLNESFANVMEYVAPDALFPKWQVWNTFIGQEGLAAFRRDSIAGVQAVKTGVKHPDEISTLFDPSIVYAKGGRLINMLMHYLGQDDFRAGLKAYFTKHAYSNTTGDDLWAALSATSGKDVAAFMDPWLKRSGFPVVTVDQTKNVATLTQKHFLLEPSKSDPERVWPLPLLSNNPHMPALLDKATCSVTLDSPAYVRINSGAIGHYIVHYAQPAHLAAVAKLAGSKQLSEAERLMLLSDSSMLARGGVQSTADTLTLLQHYANEDSEPVWDIMALILADVRRFIDVDKDLEEPIKTLIRSLVSTQYKRLGWQEQPGESSQDTKLRATIIALGVYAEHPAMTAQALVLYKAYQKDPKAVPAELRSIVFGAAIRNHTAGAFRYLLDLEESTQNVDLKADILAALTLTKQKEEAAQLLERIKDGTKVRQHDVDRWLVYLLRNRYSRTQAWRWMRDNWPWIKQTFSGDMHYDVFPRYTASAFSTPKLLAEYKAFFEPLRAETALARNIALGIEEIENRVAWLSRDLPVVQAFFKNI